MDNVKTLSDDAELLQMLGGDQRVFELLEIAVTAYAYLPANLMNWKTGEQTRAKIRRVIESFGVQTVDIPWNRFPKRFQHNRPTLHFLRQPLSEAEVEQYIADLIAANTPLPKSNRG